ncbi:MAG: hypothetical protein HOV97_05880 [Nonomuraea sp.]|nr:hypothetical protein [Nonomuraea sp.]
MTDPISKLNDHLAEENQRLSKEIDDMRALLGRPVAVNIQAPEQHVLQQIGSYLPKFGELATNTATIAGQLMQANTRQAAERQQEQSEHRERLESTKKLDHTLRRIAAALERAYPIPEEEES